MSSPALKFSKAENLFAISIDFLMSIILVYKDGYPLRIYEEKTYLHDMKFCNNILPDNLKGRAHLEGTGVDER
jgi:hypothetical protein